MNTKSTEDRTASLDSLPQELVDIIANNLEGDIPTLKSCSLTCRKLSSGTGRALLFKQHLLRSSYDCDKLLDAPKYILQHIMVLRIPSATDPPYEGLFNRPSFHQLMASLGPLELMIDSLLWSELNDGARQALSDHSFRRIHIEYSDFQSVADICFFLRSSHDLETLILPSLGIEKTMMPHWPYQAGPSVSHLTLHSVDGRLKLFESIVKTPSCPISVNKLRVLNVHVSHAEDLGLLQGVLAMTKELQELKVSHEYLISGSGVPTVADLELTSVESLTVEMSDYDNLDCPVLYDTPLFRWWCEVWANTSTTCMNKLVIEASVTRIGNRELDTTLWSQMARALSKPPWKTLSTVTIVIHAQNTRSVEALIQASYIKKIEDVMTALTETHSVEVSVTLKYPAPECDWGPEEGDSDEDSWSWVSVLADEEHN
ncbi:hypothetical protein ARMSODRAFT_962704 [Armillaria solidipes]|uniref:F-box domain-containing protein n=1 Tax=Armillaria solidipes TaxID=1076256 RepID=A0A2H3BHB2_9AGAR|nr:hypothetical protein ARMSODRAFT_962704 [Armillaria solidipes]